MERKRGEGGRIGQNGYTSKTYVDIFRYIHTFTFVCMCIYCTLRRLVNIMKRKIDAVAKVQNKNNKGDKKGGKREEGEETKGEASKREREGEGSLTDSKNIIHGC